MVIWINGESSYAPNSWFGVVPATVQKRQTRSKGREEGHRAESPHFLPNTQVPLIDRPLAAASWAHYPP